MVKNSRDGFLDLAGRDRLQLMLVLAKMGERGDSALVPLLVVVGTRDRYVQSNPGPLECIKLVYHEEFISMRLSKRRTCV